MFDGERWAWCVHEDKVAARVGAGQVLRRFGRRRDQRVAAVYDRLPPGYDVRRGQIVNRAGRTAGDPIHARLHRTFAEVQALPAMFLPDGTVRF